MNRQQRYRDRHPQRAAASAARYRAANREALRAKGRADARINRQRRQRYAYTHWWIADRARAHYEARIINTWLILREEGYRI